MYRFICYIYNKYSFTVISFPVVEKLSDSCFQDSNHIGRNFIFQKMNWLKGHWYVSAIQLTEWSLNGDWKCRLKSDWNHLSRYQSVAIQPLFTHHSVDLKVIFQQKQSMITSSKLLYKIVTISLKSPPQTQEPLPSRIMKLTILVDP